MGDTPQLNYVLTGGSIPPHDTPLKILCGPNDGVLAVHGEFTEGLLHLMARSTTG